MSRISVSCTFSFPQLSSHFHTFCFVWETTTGSSARAKERITDTGYPNRKLWDGRYFLLTFLFSTTTTPRRFFHICSLFFLSICCDKWILSSVLYPHPGPFPLCHVSLLSVSLAVLLSRWTGVHLADGLAFLSLWTLRVWGSSFCWL